MAPRLLARQHNTLQLTYGDDLLINFTSFPMQLQRLYEDVYRRPIASARVGGSLRRQELYQEGFGEEG